jgi:hypothetical protein
VIYEHLSARFRARRQMQITGTQVCTSPCHMMLFVAVPTFPGLLWLLEYKPLLQSPYNIKGIYVYNAVLSFLSLECSFLCLSFLFLFF